MVNKDVYILAQHAVHSNPSQPWTSIQ